MGDVESVRERGCQVIRLTRPAKRNALSKKVIEEIICELRAGDNDAGIRGVVLTGDETAFSTGVDLEEAVRVLSPTEFAAAWTRWRQLTEAIESSMLPVVAAINGYCLTGGLEMAMACDYRIAGDNATLGITSAKIGSVAGMGGTQRLPRLVGPSIAKRMLFKGEFVDAERALAIGLVDEVCEVAATVDRAVTLVHEIAERAPLSVGWHKQAVNRGLQMDLVSALEYERDLCARAFATRDRLEGMTAFLESREPRFRGD